jgi:hypothetical protein
MARCMPPRPPAAIAWWWWPIPCPMARSRAEAETRATVAGEHPARLLDRRRGAEA